MSLSDYLPTLVRAGLASADVWFISVDTYCHHV